MSLSRAEITLITPSDDGPPVSECNHSDYLKLCNIDNRCVPAFIKKNLNPVCDAEEDAAGAFDLSP